MNNYATGWIDKRDAIFDLEGALEKLSLSLYKYVKDFAIESHKSQKYGVYNYDIHLINVVSVLFRNDILLSYKNYSLLASAWLHDILEDTKISKEEFIDRFGESIYETVWSLTDGEGNTREEKKVKMYSKLIHNQDSIIIKLADRIANLEFSIINQNTHHVVKYLNENDSLNVNLKNHIKTELGNKLLNQLNKVVEHAKIFFSDRSDILR
ncbi:MAG: bifunctional (p)ppGpp synthetase/guanosine-3',5'-bis(diphosphate) 3'-pyrophosphohydrolase [Cytophagia bacterium]|nr:bifunctional (p)ppGpp synthetase/guanosine-3',5'-bis(diphosphate) 3'-pyrophosphohydrolase [Cytophagia bacterium]